MMERGCGFASNQCAHAGSGGHIMGNDADLRPTDAAESYRDKSHDDTKRQVDCQAPGRQQQVALSGSTRNQESQSEFSEHLRGGNQDGCCPLFCVLSLLLLVSSIQSWTQT